MRITKFLVLSFFLFTFASTITIFPSVTHAEHPRAVIDVFNQGIRAGAPYFMEVHSGLGSPGSFGVTDSTHGSCPRHVIVSSRSNMLPVIISPVKSSDNVTQQETLLTVEFGFRYKCRMIIPLIWTVRDNVVTVRGKRGIDLFKITRYDQYAGHDDNLYQLSYCPKAEHSCVQVGSVVKDGVTHLAPNGRPFAFKFRPASGHVA